MSFCSPDLLNWEHQPEKRSGSWRASILEQRRELRLLLESGTLHNHATASLPDAYQEAREQAAAETGLPIESFPRECARSIDELIAARGKANRPDANAGRSGDSHPAGSDIVSGPVFHNSLADWLRGF